MIIIVKLMTIFKKGKIIMKTSDTPWDYLNLDCTVNDIKDADTETIYNSINSNYDYSYDAITEMATQLTLRGF